LQSVDIIVTRPDEEKIKEILLRNGMPIKGLKCSICNRDLPDLKQVRAIFPYHSALVCCDNIECLIACRDKLITEDGKH
jgi:hypothetical protein